MDQSTTNLDQRLDAIRVRDVVLALLQAAFGRDDLVGAEGGSPYLFVAGDPKGSKVWISTGDARVKHTERDGRRAYITVERGDYVPHEMHLHNVQGQNFSDQQTFTDLGTSQIMIHCEEGSEVGSEVVASICYSVIKIFRRQIMADYDIHNLQLLNITTPVEQTTVPGKPWLCTVNLRVEVQEHSQMTEIANRLNKLDITAELNAVATQTIAALDGTPAL